MPNNVVPFTCPDVPCNIPPWGPFPPPWFGPSQPPWYPGANAGVTFSLTAPINVIRGHFWWDGNTLHMFDGAAWVIIGGDGSVDGGGGGGGSGQGTVIISTTPPGNPVAGMQWWNGSVLQVYDGTQWNTVGPGAAAGPVPTTTMVFNVSNNPGYVTTTAAAWTILPIVGAPTVDVSLGWDPVTKKFRPTKAGVYTFQSSVWNGGAYTVLSIIRNDQGNLTGQADDVIASGESATPGEWVNVDAMAVMNGTTDFVRVWAFAAAASGNVWISPVPPALRAWLMP